MGVGLHNLSIHAIVKDTDVLPAKMFPPMTEIAEYCRISVALNSVALDILNHETYKQKYVDFCLKNLTPFNADQDDLIFQRHKDDDSRKRKIEEERTNTNIGNPAMTSITTCNNYGVIFAMSVIQKTYSVLKIKSNDIILLFLGSRWKGKNRAFLLKNLKI